MAEQERSEGADQPGTAETPQAGEPAAPKAAVPPPATETPGVGETPQAGGPAAPQTSTPPPPATPPPATATPEDIAAAGTPVEAAPEAPPAPAAKGERPARATEGKAPLKQPAPPGSIADTIREVLPDLQFEAYQGMTDVIVEINRDDLEKTLPILKDEPRLDLKFLRVLFGVDHMDEGMDLVYQLMSLEKKHEVTVKTRVPKNDLRVASAASVWQAADWHERETRDMFGIIFEGHPHLVPLLLPEDMTDHFPLRKENALAPVEEWQGERVGEEEVANVGHIPPGSRFESLGGGKETEE